LAATASASATASSPYKSLEQLFNEKEEVNNETSSDAVLSFPVSSADRCGCYRDPRLGSGASGAIMAEGPDL
jgi:hypothetical protein